jgi:glycogen operon protein
VKLIAEPWDVGEGGYQVGNFPVKWAEWNGIYRDSLRAFWKGEGGLASDLGYRLTGSSDLYQGDGRKPSASINFISAHDGFTLRDTVSYNDKHNEANQEGNNDGHNDNRSWNCGAEGPTDDVAINRLRARQQRNLLATLLLSQGTPMLLGGDEFGRTQRGNNNAYCQDNEISWFEWSSMDRELLEFTRRVIRIRRRHPALHRQKFFSGRPIRGSDIQDVMWFRHDGEQMTDEDWQNPHTQSLAMFLAGNGLRETDPQGRPLQDDHLLLMISSSHEDLEFTFSRRLECSSWELVLDTSDDDAGETCKPGESTRLMGRSLKLFRCPLQ